MPIPLGFTQGTDWTQLHGAIDDFGEEGSWSSDTYETAFTTSGSNLSKYFAATTKTESIVGSRKTVESSVSEGLCRFRG